MIWVYYILAGAVLAGVDVIIINSFDALLLSLGFIVSLVLIRSLRRNKHGIAFLSPILMINYLYGDIKVFYFFAVFYFATLFVVKDEWVASKISEFKLCSYALLIPYALLMIFRIHFWPNIVASLVLSFLIYTLSFLIIKHDKKRILSKQGF